jgi:hypothetical protein
MDMNQLRHLPQELKADFSKLEQTFNTPGWALVVETAKKLAEEARQRQLHAQNWDIALLNRGAAFAYERLAALQESTENEFASIAAVNAEAVKARDEVDFE